MALTTGPRGDPRWGAILQEPNLYTDNGVVDRKRQMWADQTSSMSQAQQTALTSLTAALTAARDKQMADLAAADALKASRGGSGGGGGKTGGGGTSPLVPYTTPGAETTWFDQLAQQYQVQPPPPFDAHVFPSTAYSPGKVYAKPFNHVQGRPFTPAIPVPKQPKPTKFNARLS